MNQDELNEIIEKHGKWLRGEEGGERADLRDANLSNANLRYANLRSADLRDANLSNADLRYADLRDANLRDANLSDANLRDANLRYANLRSADLRDANLRELKLWSATGNGCNLISIQTDRYEIVYSDKVMQIGCEQHDIKDWWKFDDETIRRMDPGASLDWWKVWRPILKRIIKASPAKPTGYAEKQEDAA